MTNTRSDAARIGSALFHTRRHDGLYQPIAFLFVTERMRAEILAERERILSWMGASERPRQLALFARYDPAVSANAFNTILDLFHIPHPPVMDRRTASVPTHAATDVTTHAATNTEPKPALTTSPVRSRRRKTPQ